MDKAVTIIMIVLLIAQGFDVVLMPFWIGKTRTYTAVNSVMTTLVFGAILTVAGHIWGWW